MACDIGKSIRDNISVQDLSVDLSKKVDLKVVNLVNHDKEKDINQLQDDICGLIAQSAQECVSAPQHTWDSNLKWVKCLEIHMKNAAEYHQFFNEAKESSIWMNKDLEQVHERHQLIRFKGDITDAQHLLNEIQDVTIVLRQWEMKTDFLWQKGLKIVPVYKRTTPQTESIPARAIVEYITPEFAIENEEDLLLIENSDDQLWTVRNSDSAEGFVPPLAIVILGPTKEAIEVAVRLRLQLLAAWIKSLKTMGRRLLVCMLIIFKSHYSENELHLLKSLSIVESKDLLGILAHIEDTFKIHWTEHEGFQKLQERILVLRMILEQSNTMAEKHADTLNRGFIEHITTLEELTKKYQLMWDEWEKYKINVENSRAPELMLICEKWEQLKFVSRQSLTKYWQRELIFTEEERALIGSENSSLDGDNTDNEEVFVLPAVTVPQTATETTTEVKVKGKRRMSEFGFEKKMAQTEQLSSVEGEERQRFVISSVIDPRTKKEISLQDAKTAGIIKLDEGNYCDLTSDTVVPIPVAISAGLIKVVSSTTKKARERRSSVGIITMKTLKMAPRPYRIVTVKDTKTGRTLSEEEAVHAGIINEQFGVYIDSQTGKEMLIMDAIEKGYLEVEYEGTLPQQETDACAYAVRDVLDRKQNKMVSFTEAVSRGLIDKETGAYWDNKDNQTIYIGDAIMRGFIKARVLEDPNTLDIDPKNKLVVDMTATKMKKKVTTPLSVIGAFKMGLKKRP